MAYGETDAQADCMTMTENKGFIDLDWYWSKSQVNSFSNGSIIVVFPFTARNGYGAKVWGKSICTYNANKNKIYLTIK